MSSQIEENLLLPELRDGSHENSVFIKREELYTRESHRRHKLVRIQSSLVLLVMKITQR